MTRTPEQPVTVTPGPVEPADTEVRIRTFADVENGDPDSLFDEIVLDAAII